MKIQVKGCPLTIPVTIVLFLRLLYIVTQYKIVPQEWGVSQRNLVFTEQQLKKEEVVKFEQTVPYRKECHQRHGRFDWLTSMSGIFGIDVTSDQRPETRCEHQRSDRSFRKTKKHGRFGWKKPNSVIVWKSVLSQYWKEYNEKRLSEMLTLSVRYRITKLNRQNRRWILIGNVIWPSVAWIYSQCAVVLDKLWP